VRILVAGIGNVFLGDDGFGPAVASALGEQSWPAHVEIADFGIRGFDLAFALTSGVDAAVLVDAIARGGAPGTLYSVEPDIGDTVPSVDRLSAPPCGGAARSGEAGPFDRCAVWPAAGGSHGGVVIHGARSFGRQTSYPRLMSAAIPAMQSSRRIATLELVRVVGCEPARLGEEDGDISVGLSEPVASAIVPAVAMIAELVAELEARCTS
jgi:hydrogenase maturation protease